MSTILFFPCLYHLPLNLSHHIKNPTLKLFDYFLPVFSYSLSQQSLFPQAPELLQTFLNRQLLMASTTTPPSPAAAVRAAQ
jgi:hypothetical protein